MEGIRQELQLSPFDSLLDRDHREVGHECMQPIAVDEDLAQTDDSTLLAWSNGLEPVPERGRSACRASGLHLYKVNMVAPLADQVDLALSCTKPPREDPMAPPLEEGRSSFFTAQAEGQSQVGWSGAWRSGNGGHATHPFARGRCFVQLAVGATAR